MKKNLFAAAAFVVGGPSAAAKAHKFATAIERVVKPQREEPIRVKATREGVYVITTL